MFLLYFDIFFLTVLPPPYTRNVRPVLRYGLYDPLKGEQAVEPGDGSKPDDVAAGNGGGGGGIREGSGRGGLPGAFAPRLMTGVGDHGAG